MASAVSDEVPEFDPRQRRRGGRQRRLERRALGMVASAAVVLGLLAFGLSVPTTQTPRSQLIAATQATIATQTARVRLTSVPSVAMQIGQNAVAMTATGVVDFAVPALEVAYPDGYSWVDIGNRSWQTVWPPNTGVAKWERSTSPTEPPHTGAAQLLLAKALKADTSPGALLAALRTGTQRVTRLGSQTLDGVRAEHYRASVGKVWRADVWVAKGQLVRLEVEGPSGSLSEHYYDFGVPVHITAP
jgi:hypothetical protein